MQNALLRFTFVMFALLSTLSVTSANKVEAEEIKVLFGSVDIPAPIPTPVPDVIPADVPIVAPPPNLEEVSTYIMRTTPPEELIRYMWRNTPDADLMVRIAAREACLFCKHRDGTPFTPAEICSADNPGSSAAGLFQTMGFHRTLAEGMGLSWANVTGPDCWDDARLAFQLYNNGKGLRNWAPLP